MNLLERVRDRFHRAWTGGDSLSTPAPDALPASALDRLAFVLLLEGLLDPADLRRARWFARDASESALLLLLLARLRRGHGCASVSDLRSDLDVLASTARSFAALRETPLAGIPATFAADLEELGRLLGNAASRAVSERGAFLPLVRAEELPDGIVLSFARAHDAQTLLATRLLDRIRLEGGSVPSEPPPGLLDAVCERLPPLHEGQEEAVRRALVRRTLVVSGGPGTGKTTVVARVLEALSGTEPGFAPESIALCAPTGRAKARLRESIGKALPGWGAPPASTLHSLLGTRPDGSFRHDAGNPLPFSMVVVDEASMIDLALFAALLDALAPGTRLLLLGDPDQLPSVEAGAVFGDLVELLEQAGGETGTHHARLTFTHRNAGRIRALAEETNRGETESVTALDIVVPGTGEALRETLRTDPVGTVRWIGGDLEDALALWWDLHGVGRPGSTLESEAETISRSRVLCAAHQGASGRERVNELGDEHLRALARRAGLPPGAGRPVVLTRNLPALDLWNGDLGVSVQSDDMRHVLFARGGGFVAHPPERLEGLEPAWAITIHKSQGSEFDHVLLVLPEDDTPLLTRQILYTGLTRARRTLWIWGRKDLWALGASRRERRMSRFADLVRAGLGTSDRAVPRQA